MSEYFLKFWGGAEKAIEEAYGITQRNHYFPTKQQRDDFKAALEKFGHLGLVFDEKEGALTHKRTIAVMVFEFDGHQYIHESDFGFEYEPEAAAYMFRDGNYACDCNRSLFILQDGHDFPEMECGDRIKLLSFKIELRP